MEAPEELRVKYCFPPGTLFRSPPLTKSMQGKIFNRVGKYAEERVGEGYQAFTGRNSWYPVPIDSPDFRDGNQGLNSKTIYYSFLVEKNPGVDKQKLEKLMNDRAIRGDDGQILYIPDFMSEKAPVAKRFHEVKPGMPAEENEAGETKIASVRAFMQELGLPYAPGTSFKAEGRHELFSQPVFVPGMALFPIPVTVTFEYKSHSKIDGLIVYHFCIDANFKKALALALIIALAAVIILAVLFPELLEGIPLPSIPIPKIPELPIPRPSPFPIPAPPIPVPVPAVIEQLKILLSSFPATGHESPKMARAAIGASVGNQGHNFSGDVQTVQFLLNAWHGLSAQRPLELDGIAGPLTCASITSLQRAAGLNVVNGKVDPGSPTLDVLGKLGAIGIKMSVKSGATRYIAADVTPISKEGDLVSLLWSGLSSSRSG